MIKKVLILIVFSNIVLFAQDFDLKLAQSTYLIYQRKNTITMLDPENLYIKSNDYTFHNYINMSSRASLGNLLCKGSFQLDYNELNKTKYDFTFKEAYLSYDLTDNLQLKAGRKFINWGVDYYLRPSAILDPQKNVSDFDNQTSKYVGNDVFEMDYYAGNLLFRGVYKNSFNHFTYRKSEYVGNINFLLDGWAVNIIGEYDELSKWKAGFNFTKVLGDQMEIHGEYINEKNQINYGINDALQYLDLKERINKFTMGFLLSMDIAHRDVRLICEYNYDQGGLTGNKWDIYKSYINESLMGMKNPSADVRKLSKSNYIDATTSYNVQEFSISSAICIVDNLPPLFNLIYYKPIILYNPSDHGSILILNLFAHTDNGVNFFFNTNYYGGDKNSIYFNIPYKYQLFFGISTNFDLIN